jgi:hypothetical protein
MPFKSADAALRDILHHIDLANQFDAGFDEKTFHDDLRTVYAVIRCLEIFHIRGLAALARRYESAPSFECVETHGGSGEYLPAQLRGRGGALCVGNGATGFAALARRHGARTGLTLQHGLVRIGKTYILNDF